MDVIYHDDEFAVVCKALGIPSQPDKSGDPSALSIAEEILGRRLLPVHRIDRPASGLLILACGRRAAERLSAMLREGAMERRYWAIVEGLPENDGGEMEGSISFDRHRNRSTIDSGGKPARLRYAVRTRGERYSLLEILLQTGRHHQIRVQLSAASWPVRGDLKYGARRSLPGGGIALHAVSLRFAHPATGAECRFSARPPADRLWDALAAGLEADAPFSGC